MKTLAEAVETACHAFVELLEPRRLLHGGHDYGGGDGGDGDHSSGDDLDPAIVAEVRKLVLAGEDVGQYVDTPYDPHRIGVESGDGILVNPIPLDPGALRAPSLVLPDMFPWTGPTGSNYYKNISFDTSTQPGRRLMRFSTAIANKSSGPVELLGGTVNPDGTQQVHQRLYNFDPVNGQFTVAGDRLAGNFIYHAGHGHLHFEGYAEYKLLKNVNGQPGDVATRADGTPVYGEKVGFCLINVTTYDSSIPGYSTSPTGYGCGNRQGVSVGRADVYGSGLDNQWVDITGVPAGSYFLSVTLDVGNAVLEADETNNTILVPVTLNDGPPPGGVQPDRFDVIAVNNTFATATDFESLGDRTEHTLTLHAGYDEDFYSFVAASTGTATINLTYASGNPDLFLYNASQVELDRSTRTSGTETVSASVVAGQTYYIHVNMFQSTSTLVSDYTLAIDGPLPTVTSGARYTRTLEGNALSFQINRNGPIVAPLTVPLVFGGTAIKGVDYTVSTESVQFGAEASSVTVTLTALTDNIREITETVLVSIASSSSYVTGSAPLKLLILDNSGSDPSIPGPRGHNDGDGTGRDGGDFFARAAGGPRFNGELLFGEEDVLDDLVTLN